MDALQSLTGNYRVFTGKFGYREIPITCFDSVQGLQGQFLLYVKKGILCILYDSLSLVQLQMGIGSPKWHLFDQQFRVGVGQIFCKQWSQGPGKVFKF